MKTFTKTRIAIAALAALFTVSNASAQLELGEDCGCPDLASRGSVNLSTLTDASGNLPVGDTHLTCDNVYMIDEKVYVQDGADLYIQPGTILRGVFGLTVDANALIVSRGGQIWANGNDCCPIIFTDENDPLDGTYSVDIRGQWGGVIVLGYSPNNLLLADGGLAVADGVGNIEGLLPGDSRNHYGGSDSEDNSGIMRYVSIRHGGTDIGEANEINGLTLGSVGSGTTLEYIEVTSNNDDGIEFFGGSVDLKYCHVAYCNDDYFDWDQGWNGRGQFWYGLQLPGASPQGDEGYESDGDDEDSGNLPSSNPTIYNATMIGRGANRGVLAKEGTNGHIANSIFVNWAAGVDLATEGDRPFDSYDQYLAETLTFSNNCFDGVTDLLTVGGATAGAVDLASFQGAGNTLAPGVIDWSFDIDIATNAVSDALNPVPTGDVTSPEVPPVDDFFSGANYKGAFKPGTTPWTTGWTLNQVIGADNSIASCPEDVDSDGDVDVDDFLQLIGAFNTSCGI